MIQPYREFKPVFGENVRVHDSSVVIGRTTLGQGCSIWPAAVLRGDYNTIDIGARTNIQDGAVIHVDHGFPTFIGEDCVVGHQACVHGCSIGARTLVGIHSIILSGAQVGAECIIGAGALVPEGKVIPPRSLVLGMPARVIRQVSDDEVQGLLESVRNYMNYAAEQMPLVK